MTLRALVFSSAADDPVFVASCDDTVEDWVASVLISF